MVNPSRGPERLIRSGQWLIALLFAYFLIQVGASLIADLPLLAKAPRLEQFVDQPKLERLQAAIQPLSESRDQIQSNLAALREKEIQAREAYGTDQASFENWRSARSATEQSAQNPEVIARVRQLDAQLQRQRQLSNERQTLEGQLTQLQERIAPAQRQLDQLQAEAQERWQRARQGAEGRAFGIRLLFVGPLLALAIWQFRRFRSSDQWPFVWGFLLFGLFAFFFELVPYLPSFGGYIRYGVGALLTFLGGRALIRWLNAYLLRKQLEQAAPQEQRQGRIRYENALQSVGRNQCPSCERSLSRNEGQLPNYCMHCGLQIQHDCPRCNHHHLTFFPYCPSCGLGAEESRS
jgi:predicted RNA-binding Zn-ribbon protein involved in translation (DUF1610 family)